MTTVDGETSDVEMKTARDGGFSNEIQFLDDLELLLYRYPGIMLDKSHDGQMLLRGNAKIQNTWFYVQLKCPYFPSTKGLVLQVHELHEVKTIMSDSPSIDQKWTVLEVLENLPKIIDHKICVKDKENESPQPPTPESNYFLEVASLYAPELYKIHLNSLTTRLKFSNFKDNEEHYLEISLQPSLMIIAHSLPDCVVHKEEMVQKCHTLTALLQQFRKYLEDLREFYENLHEIDELCYVLQPVKPTTKDNWRLFSLRKGVFIKLRICDPFAPMASLSVNIIGPSYEVEQLRRTYSDGLCDWDSELNIHKNLLRIFDLCFFPMPPDKDESASEQCCKICFDYQLEDNEIPLLSCDNKRCAVIYHGSCLKKWFGTLSDGKVFLDVSFGECPFCKAKLSTSFNELLKS